MKNYGCINWNSKQKCYLIFKFDGNKRIEIGRAMKYDDASYMLQKAVKESAK